jgi:WD40 repeat protein
VRVLSAHKKAITCVAFARDGERLAEAAHGGRVRVWNLTTGTVEHTFDASEGLFPNQVKLAFTADGAQLAVANDRVLLFDLKNGDSTELPGSSAFNGLHVSPCGAELMGHGDALLRWTLADGKKLPAYKLPVAGGGRKMLTFPGAAYSACGALVAVARRAWGQGTGNVNTVFVIERASGEVVTSFDSAGNDQKRLAFSPDAQWLAAACGPVLRVYDLAALEEVAALKAGKLHFMAVAFSPNGKWLATVSKDRTTRLWEVGAWGEPRTYEWDAGKLLDLAFAPDGATAAVASNTGKIVIFDVD